MIQVGDIRTFKLQAVPPASAKVYAYVWRWWDGSTTTTAGPSVEKTVNIGGNPTLVGRKLYYSVTPVLEDGQSVTIGGEIEVNNPPQVVPSPTVTKNDDFFPFATRISLTAYDLENDTINFCFASSGSALGKGVTTGVGNVSGTWNGTYAGLFAGTQAYFDWTITKNQRITALIWDNQNGTTVLNFDFRGSRATTPVLSLAADPRAFTADPVALPSQRIGTGQNTEFSVYARDQVANSFNFLWSFPGSHGWITSPTFSNGTTAVLADGAIKNSVLRSIEGEDEGVKTATVKVTSNTSGSSVSIPITVLLLANSAGTTANFSITADGSPIEPLSSVTPGQMLAYTADVEDPDVDVVSYLWEINQPAGIDPSVLKLWGRTVFVDTTGYPSEGTNNITGTLKAYDRFGKLFSTSIPVVKT